MIVPVEIEVNIEGNVDEALSTLNDALGPTTKRQIWFAEARAGAATGELTLLVNHVIVRLRRGDGPDDLTLKLRPCVERQLGGRWQESFHTKSFDYRIELKATGPGRGRYWRLRRARNTARALDVAGPSADPASVFSDQQRQFLLRTHWSTRRMATGWGSLARQTPD